MDFSVFHNFLVKSPDFSSAQSHIENFLQKTTLIRYSSIFFDKSKSFAADMEEFWAEVDSGIAENRKTVENLIDELELCGYKSLQDLFFVKQGFESKMLHTVTHMLDGFIGVDSVFYNLIEDSHWISSTLREEIISHPGQFWLVHVVAGEVEEAILHKTPRATSQ